VELAEKDDRINLCRALGFGVVERLRRNSEPFVNAESPTGHDRHRRRIAFVKDRVIYSIANFPISLADASVYANIIATGVEQRRVGKLAIENNTIFPQG